MKKSVDQIDALIREALSREEKEVYESYAERSIFRQAIDVLHGRQRWVAITSMGVTLAFVGLAALCAVRFFEAEEMRPMIMWGAGFFFSMMIVLALKIWYWMEMSRNALSREMKRLELQVAQLLQELRKG